MVHMNEHGSPAHPEIPSSSVTPHPTQSRVGRGRRVNPSNTSDADPISPWQRVTVAGLAVLCVVLVAVQVVNRSVVPPAAAFTIVSGGLAIWARRSAGPIALLVASAAAAVVVVANLPAAIENLRHPESVASFVPTSTAVVAGVFVAASGVLATARRVPRAARPTAATAAGLVVLGVVVAGIASVSAHDDQQQAGDIVVDVRDSNYPDLTMPAGTNTFYVDNHDLIRHTLLIGGTDVDVEIPGSTARRVAVELEPGSYRYICDVIGHEAMVGVLTMGG